MATRWRLHLLNIDVLSVSASLTKMFLSGNELGAEGAKALAPGIAASSTIWPSPRVLRQQVPLRRRDFIQNGVNRQPLASCASPRARQRVPRAAPGPASGLGRCAPPPQLSRRFIQRVCGESGGCRPPVMQCVCRLVPAASVKPPTHARSLRMR